MVVLVADVVVDELEAVGLEDPQADAPTAIEARATLYLPKAGRESLRIVPHFPGTFTLRSMNTTYGRMRLLFFYCEISLSALRDCCAKCRCRCS